MIDGPADRGDQAGNDPGAEERATDWSHASLQPPPIPDVLRASPPGSPTTRTQKTAAFLGTPNSDHLNAWSLGWTVASGVIGGAVVGGVIDWLAGTLPIFLLAFALLGIGSGLYQLFRKAITMNAPAPPNKRGSPGSPDR